jgi:hypothetical protein
MTITRLSDGYICETARKERVYVYESGRDDREFMAAQTDDELFKTEITHCFCRG